MKKIILIGILVLLPIKLFALGPFDQSVWKVDAISTSTVKSTVTAMADRWMAGDFNVGISTSQTYIKLGATGTINCLDIVMTGGGTMSSTAAFATNAGQLDGKTGTYYIAASSVSTNYLSKSSATATYLNVAGGTLSGPLDTSLTQLEISTNAYIVGYSSAAIYYGDGSNLTNIAMPVNYISFNQYGPMTMSTMAFENGIARRTIETAVTIETAYIKTSSVTTEGYTIDISTRAEQSSDSWFVAYSTTIAVGQNYGEDTAISLPLAVGTEIKLDTRYGSPGQDLPQDINITLREVQR